MAKNYEELKRELFSDSTHYDQLVQSGEPGIIKGGIMYYRREVQGTLAELRKYFGINKNASEYSRQKEVA